ncbi:MAG: 3-phosphoshikimate 1-carboxyvinyltransferase [Bacteroidetes bacterium]|nr:3-phosphoshikimate 1-carboxyvinyltransferase [Bacteroidota bacterium]
MQVTINPSFVFGKIIAPSSKSMMQRVCAAALLHQGSTTIFNPGTSADDQVALTIIEHCGAQVLKTNTHKTVIQSTGKLNAVSQIDCGESGLSARLFTPILSMSNQPVLINGQGNLLSRPMPDIEPVLNALKVTFNSHLNCLPFTIQGPLQPKDLRMDGRNGSQFLTGLLYALSYAPKETITITVEALQSKPYIDLTLDILAHFGKHIRHENYERFTISTSSISTQKEIEITIEGDWSSAAYWLVAGAIHGNVVVENLNPASCQADRKIIEILQKAGANCFSKNNTVLVTESNLSAFEVDLSDSPDLFPIVSVLAACSKGMSLLHGVHRLWYKESNREQSIKALLSAFGVVHKVENNSLIIEGQDTLKSFPVNGFNDHRIVMAATIGSLRAEGLVTISDSLSVRKSYPSFFEDAASLGLVCSVN